MSQQNNNSNQSLSAAQARKEAWKRGLLTFKLDSTQRQLLNIYQTSPHKIQTLLLSRRSGKTYYLVVLALQQCLKQPRSIVKFACPTRLQVQTIIRPLINQIMEDCPQELRPEFKTQDFIYYFPNGSELQLAGTESGHAEKLRGGSSHIAIVDEAQDVSDLDNVVKSVLLPTTLTTKGKVIISGTPPKSIDHPFMRYVEEAEKRGALVKKTVYDNPRISKEDLDEILREYPSGISDESFRREYMCELIKDSKISVIPEFTEELEKELVKEWPRPPYFDAYVAMDLGFTDLTAVIFGYYDFRAAKIIIEDEICADFTKKDMNVRTLTSLINKKEEELWTNVMSGEIKRPYLRVSDINPIVIKEIYVESNGVINFLDTKKDDKETALNNLRLLIANKKIIINPRCVNLIRHLRNVKWASQVNKKTFGRSPDSGHYDFVDAMIYFVRSVSFSKNPYPAGFNLAPGEIFIPNPSHYYMNSGKAKAIDVYKKIFGRKK